MKKYINLIIRFRWFIAILIPLLSLGFATQLKHIEFDGSYRIWFGKESQTLKQYDEFKAVFGSDSSLIIAFHDENGIMNPKALGVINR